jgi:DNA polymerase
MIHRDKIPLLWLLQTFGLNELYCTSGYFDKGKALSEIKRKVTSCRRCPLHKNKKNYVFGSGNPYAPLLFVGEAPGRDEDEKGKPFVGKAGQLLTELMQGAGIRREMDAYIANVLKCRPPGNRDPLPEEIKACSPYLEEQIKIIKPRLICALGRFAAGFLLDIKNPLISRLRGRLHRSKYDIPLVVTYHPAAILRNPNQIEETKKDFEFLKYILEGNR